MKIQAIASGGFAGLTEKYTVDTAEHPEKKALENTIKNIDFFNADPDISKEVAGADLIRWQISVTDGDRQHDVIFVPDGGPETADWQTLVNEITQFGKKN